MDDNNEDDAKIAPLPSTSLLTDLRDSALRCREILRKLSSVEGSMGSAAEEMMATFNILAANMGIFRQGQHSLVARLQSAPEVADLILQLLDALDRRLGISNQLPGP